MDYYRVLGLQPSCTEADIKRAFRSLALKHHPDKNGGIPSSTEKFKLINIAHEVLSDPDKRKLFDLYGETLEPPESPAEKPDAPRSDTYHHTSASDPSVPRQHAETTGERPYRSWRNTYSANQSGSAPFVLHYSESFPATTSSQENRTYGGRSDAQDCFSTGPGCRRFNDNHPPYEQPQPSYRETSYSSWSRRQSHSAFSYRPRSQEQSPSTSPLYSRPEYHNRPRRHHSRPQSRRNPHKFSYSSESATSSTESESSSCNSAPPSPDPAQDRRYDSYSRSHDRREPSPPPHRTRSPYRHSYRNPVPEQEWTSDSYILRHGRHPESPPPRRPTSYDRRDSDQHARSRTPEQPRFSSTEREQLIREWQAKGYDRDLAEEVADICLQRRREDATSESSSGYSSTSSVSPRPSELPRRTYDPETRTDGGRFGSTRRRTHRH